MNTSAPAERLSQVKFIAHACIQLTHGGKTLLCDPWFSGRVFNSSWELLAPPDTGWIDWERLGFIWISHEHPDHFHLPTLKAIAASAKHKITVLFPRQKNKNVVEALRKLGFDVLELDNESPVVLDGGLRVTCYRFRSDSALVIQSATLTILNQNDCRLPPTVARRIRRRHGPIHLWLFQFSLAGYYANSDKRQALARAQRAHLDLVRKYDRLLKPERFVPFASFVAFCRDANRYLNEWRVRPSDVVALQGLHAQTQLLCGGDAVLSDTDSVAARNARNATAWDAAFDRPVASEPDLGAKPNELQEVGQAFAAAVRAQWPRLALPPALSLYLTDLQIYAHADLRSGRFTLQSEATGSVAADIDSGSLLFLLRFPWGAETVHISACFYVHDAFRWKWFTYVRHAQYKLSDRGALMRFAPLGLAFLQTKLRGAWYS